MDKGRNSILGIGCNFLKVFCATTALATIILLPGVFGRYESRGNLFEDPLFWGLIIAAVVVVESILFWIGIITVYLTSVQLGIKWRILGVVFGWVPVVNLIMLGIIIRICGDEVRFEKRKFQLNDKRKEEKICKTKYPILLVHGVFFRDFEHVNYWGRIPGELEKNGATLFYGNHNSAAAVDDSAKELEERIRQIVEDTGCEKVNIIAHSKGGLDSRTAVAKTSIAPYVASITTINTPHRGCEFADYLLGKIPKKAQLKIAETYNLAAEKLGDVNPDFLAAVNDLTHSHCEARNKEVQDVPGIFYQSFGSKLNKPFSGQFPLNMTSMFVKFFDGANDGLVGEESFPWGENYTFLQVAGNRGISHGDIIDLNRENIREFDVREFYVQLVAELKRKGL